MSVASSELIATVRMLPQFARERNLFALAERREGELPFECGVFPHGYQPDRFLSAPDGTAVSIQLPIQERNGWRFVSINGVEYPYDEGGYYVEKFNKRYDDINDLINDQTYRSVLWEPVPELFIEAATNNGEFPKPPEFPQGITFSWYRSLRSWMRHKYAQQFEQTAARIRALPEREWRVLADPGEHVILPNLPPDDQDTLIKIGQLSSLQDLGFIPNGIWAPETALTSGLLQKFRENGYLYTVARSDQMQSTESNPMWVQTPAGEIAVFFFDKGESGSIAFDDSRTENGDAFLIDMKNKNRRSISLGMDLETYGHWKEDRNWWLLYMVTVMQSKYGYQPFNIKEMIGRERHLTEIIENSSWSCDHGLERWRGGENCDCDHPSYEARADKRLFYDTLTDYNERINASLDKMAKRWRDLFVPFYLAVDEPVTQGGDIMQTIQEFADSSGEKILRDPEIVRRMLAKYYIFKGFTSCGWFFGETDRVERELPRFGIATAEKLVPELKVLKQEDEVFVLAA